MKKLFPFYCLLLLMSTLLASAQTEPSNNQTITLHGRITDATNMEPLAFATLSINKLGIGTASNMDGDWTLQIPASASTETLSVTFMGYTTRTIPVSELVGNVTIQLQPKSYQMAEVVVTQKDFCKEFLQKAWNAIPYNYPTQPTRCEGFYRETERLKDSTFLYFNEAVLDVYKNSYKNTTNFGQIRVEKSRKNVFPGIDSINDVRFYGGPHFPNDLDIVFSRWDFIKPSEYSNWKIELVGTLKDSISDIYVLSFKNRKLPNSSFQGKMYIDRDSYAFIGFDFWRAGLSNLAGAQLPDMEYIPGMTSIKIGYTEQNGMYHLGFINYKTNGLNTASKKRIYKDIEYVTTSIQTDSVTPIPFGEQFDYTDILSIEAQPYDSSYWKDYNILEQSKLMNNQANLSYQKQEALQQLTKTYNKELTDSEKALLFLKRFTFDGGIAYLPIHYPGGTHELINNGTSLSSQPVKSAAFGISTQDGIRFELNKKWSLTGTISTALFGVEQLQLDLGAAYRISLAPSGRWIFMDLGLAASNVTTKLELFKFDNPGGNLVLDHKTFDSEKLVLKAGKTGFGLKPSIGFSVRAGKQYELFTDASWFQALLLKRDYLQVKEANGFFLSRQSYKTNWNDPALQLKVNGATVTTPPFEVQPWNIRIGIRSGF
ncbi:MAG TPA: carboxypeptidase-like regulatory domain-containing protein [Bacteroidales bacterium]|nr:carboxypeptidase-like regulatory domain-containing protein [Bacteroidales bacterium]